MEHVLIKWKTEDCWDVIPLSEIQHNGCYEVNDIYNSAIIGTEVNVKFEGEDHPAVILEVGQWLCFFLLNCNYD